MTSSLKPLKNGPKVLSPEEALAILDDVPTQPDEQPTEPQIMPSADTRYSWVRGWTYAKAVEKLQKFYGLGECRQHPTVKVKESTYVRPLTFEETIRARIENFEKIKDENGDDRPLTERLDLLNCPLASCTGIAYRGEDYRGQQRRMKFIDEEESLITIHPSFEGVNIPLDDYDSLNGREVSFSKKFNSKLTKDEVFNHPGWRAVVLDQELLRAYTDLVFAESKGEKNMDFIIHNYGNSGHPRLHALILCAFSWGSSIQSNVSLGSRTNLVMKINNGEREDDL